MQGAIDSAHAPTRPEGSLRRLRGRLAARRRRVTLYLLVVCFFAVAAILATLVVLLVGCSPIG
jgi:hypothetical protein